MIIDIDTHFEPGRAWLSDQPTLARVPAERRPPTEALLPPGLAAILCMGRYPYELTPGEFARRNIRVTPLPRVHSPVGLLAEYPEGVVFSSDYAHHESNLEPTAHYADLLAGVALDVRESFLGANLAECYARMGDPLPSATKARP